MCDYIYQITKDEILIWLQHTNKIDTGNTIHIKDFLNLYGPDSHIYYVDDYKSPNQEFLLGTSRIYRYYAYDKVSHIKDLNSEWIEQLVDTLKYKSILDE